MGWADLTNGACSFLPSSSSSTSTTTSSSMHSPNLCTRASVRVHTLPHFVLEEILLYLPAGELVKSAAVCDTFLRCVQGRKVQKVLRLYGVFAVGGWDGQCELASIESWRLSPSSPAALVIPGPERDWGVLPDMTSRRSHVGTAVVNRKVYVAGGRDGDQRLCSFECFDPLTEQVTLLPPMKLARSSLAFHAVGRKLYAFGGFDGTQEHRHNEVFDITTQQWTYTKVLDARRSQMASALHNNEVYLLGGCKEMKIVADVLKYSPERDQFFTLSPMKERRVCSSACVLDGLIYVLGGSNEHHTFRSVECYDPRCDTWTAAPDLLSKRVNLGCATFEDTVVAVGGYSNNQLRHVERFYPKDHALYDQVAAEASASVSPASSFESWVHDSLVSGLNSPSGHTNTERAYLDPLLQGDPSGAWKPCAKLKQARDAVSVCMFD